jgi:hypothetical protein
MNECFSLPFPCPNYLLENKTTLRVFYVDLHCIFSLEVEFVSFYSHSNAVPLSKQRVVLKFHDAVDICYINSNVRFKSTKEE